MDGIKESKKLAEEDRSGIEACGRDLLVSPPTKGWVVLTLQKAGWFHPIQKAGRYRPPQKGWQVLQMASGCSFLLERVARWFDPLPKTDLA